MTRFFISLALLLAYSCTIAVAAEPVRVMTFNILASQPSWETDAKCQPWAVRKPIILDVMQNYPDGNGPYDFIGTQETSVHDKTELHQVKQLAEEMKGYGSLYAPCTGKENVFGLTNMIFWKNDRWEIDPQDSGTFWLSSTPDVPGSNDWSENNRGGQRCVTYGLFHEINAQGRTGKKVYFYNTHLNVHVPPARVRSAFLIMEKIQNRKSPNTPVLLAGDFNSRRTTEPVIYFQGDKVEFEEKTYTPPFGLKEAFDIANPGKPAPGIDFIFFNDYFKPVSAKSIPTNRDGVYPSDHRPIEAAFEWK
jgi:endonuclease/exonuclease/phosphatase family metal-dependent hydrolase